MLLLEASNIEKYFSDRLILGISEFKVHSGDKIGIIGQNGSGKTTLLNILSGDMEPDKGFVHRYCNITYIQQFSEEMISAKPKLLKEFNLSQKSKQDIFSGGEHTRIKLANAFSENVALIFADEPTANLDYKGIEILKEKLSAIETFLLISHDRDLLNLLCNNIVELRDAKLKFYKGNYSDYKEQSEIEQKYEKQEYENYVLEKTKLESSISKRQKKAATMKRPPKRMGNSEARLHRRDNMGQRKVNNSVNNLKTRLNKLELKEKPEKLAQIKLDFTLTNPPENKIVISGKNLMFSYGNNKIFINTSFNIHNGSKIALWGENGSGKSTLLNLIFESSNKNIYVVPKAKIGYFHQDFKNLELEKTVLENVIKDSIQTQSVVRTILARLLISGDDVHKKVENLSGGEKIRVSFAKLFVSDANVLLLDEPTNYLDMLSIEALENVLCDYEGTVVLVSHDSMFVNKVADRLLILENKSIKEFEGTLQEYNDDRRKSTKSQVGEMEKMIVKMKIAEIVTKLSAPHTDEEIKEDLEAEYQELILKLEE